jgi:ribosomal-protein-alanine N-acetyltransferase
MISFESFPNLETERLTLRQLNLNDAKAIFSLRTNKEVNEFITREVPNNLAEARAFIDSVTNLIDENKAIFWIIESKNNNELIGSIGLRHFDVEDNYAEIGYEINPSYQQRGLMNEAFEVVLEFAFEEMELETIEAFTHMDNDASIALLEKHNFVYQSERIDDKVESNYIYRLENS